MSSLRPSAWAVVNAHLRADPRKTGVLAVLFVVLAMVVGRLWLGSGGAAEAEAQAGSQAAAGTANATPPGSGVPNAARIRARAKVSVPAAPATQRADPFAVDADVFPRTRSDPDEEPGPEAPPTGGRADEIRAAAASLHLQSTLSGASPLACISGRVVQPGDRIDGFVVESIAPGNVVLRRDGVRVMLQLR